MKIKLLKDSNILLPAGTEVDVPENRGNWLISVGSAEEAKKPAKKAKDKE